MACTVPPKDYVARSRSPSRSSRRASAAFGPIASARYAATGGRRDEGRTGAIRNGGVDVEKVPGGHRWAEGFDYVC